jgi:K+/H+ antiporter YhaU regulatory subunit KhtT
VVLLEDDVLVFVGDEKVYEKTSAFINRKRTEEQEVQQQ